MSNEPKSTADLQFVGGENIAMKIPKYKYEETVHFYKELIKLPYLGVIQGAHVFKLGPSTLWLDQMETYAQQDVWLQVQVNDVEQAKTYLQENGTPQRNEVEYYENDKGFWISDPCGTILRVDRIAPAKE